MTGRSETTTARAPSLRLFLTEPSRGALQVGALPLSAPWLARAPRGEPHGVLVLPGFMTTDFSTQLLRRYVRGLGHTVWGWRLGRNLGPTSEILDGMPQAVELLAERTGSPVSVVGWSLGGVFAREIARRRPDLVRQVITLGSPFALRDPAQSRVGRAFRRQGHLRCAHLGFGADPATFWVVADRLAQRDPGSAPFRSLALLRLMYPTPTTGHLR